MSLIELVANKNSFLLNIDGYLYYRHSPARGTNVKWKCRNKPLCFVSVTTTAIGPNIQIVRGGPDVSLHKCVANAEEVEGIKYIESGKRRAVERPDAPLAQIMSGMSNLPSGVLAELPSRSNVRQRYARARNKNLPTNPMSIADLGEIPAEFRKSLSGN